MEIMQRPLVDIRQQVGNVLAELGYEVSMEFPAEKPTFPLITFAQISNTYQTPSTQRLVFQTDIWAQDPIECFRIAGEVCEAMDGLNFRLTYESPDTKLNENINIYHKALSFEATADLIFKRLM